MIFRSKSKIPGWFVGLAVLVTAGLTGWAVFKKSGGTWPDQTGSLPMQVTEVFSPTVAAMNPNSFQKVAGTRQVPVIRTGSVPKHRERGACTLCHTVVDALGKAIPSIGTMARLPHNYNKGLCINCHKVGSNQSSSMGGFGTLAAGQAPAPAPGPLASPQAGAARGALPPLSTFARQQRRQPTEGAWLGMEVVPITRLTAVQYGIPANMRGLVVAEAEGQAAISGVRAGDVVVAANGIPVSEMRTFLQATGGGKQQAGSVDLMRSGRFLKVVLGQAPRVNAVQGQVGKSNTNTNMRPVAAPSARSQGIQGNTAPGLGNGNGNGYGIGRGRGLGLGGATCPNGLRR